MHCEEMVKYTGGFLSQLFYRPSAFTNAWRDDIHNNSVRPSVHHTLQMYCIQMAEHIVQILSPLDSPIILVFSELIDVTIFRRKTGIK